MFKLASSVETIRRMRKYPNGSVEGIESTKKDRSRISFPELLSEQHGGFGGISASQVELGNGS